MQALLNLLGEHFTKIEKIPCCTRSVLLEAVETKSMPVVGLLCADAACDESAVSCASEGTCSTLLATSVLAVDDWISANNRSV